MSRTCLVVICVVSWHVVLKELGSTSSHVPVYIRIPLVTVSTQVRLLKITLYIQKNETSATDLPDVNVQGFHAASLHPDIHMWIIFFLSLLGRCVSNECVTSPTQAVSRTDVDLKYGHATPRTLPWFTFNDNLIKNICSVIPSMWYGLTQELHHRRWRNKWRVRKSALIKLKDI